MRLCACMRAKESRILILTFFSCPRLAQHVVFGQVVEGMSVVRAVEAAGAEARVRIADCGVLA